MLRIARSMFPFLVILSLLLASCAGGGGAETPGAAVTQPGGVTEPTMPPVDGEPTAPAGDGVPTEPAAGGETPAAGGGEITLDESCATPVDLQYWNPFTGPDGPFMGQMVDAFNSENPNVIVTMTSQADYYTQLQTAAAAGTLPDVAIVHADQVATNVFRNVLRPIDDIVTQMGVSAEDFPGPVWEAGEVAGQRYSIPLDIHPMTMFYNADLLAEAGIDAPPTTAEEFEAAATAMTQGENQGFDITGGFPVQQIFQMLLHQYGGTEFNEDGTEATWNSEAGVQALQWMKDAQSQWSEPNLEVDAELAAFKAGGVGLIWNGIWQTTNVTGDAVAFDGRATAVPQIGPEMAVWAGSHQLTIPTQANPDPCKEQAAAMLIRYLLDNSVTWAQAGQIPASNAVRSSEEFMAIEPQASIASSVEFAFFPPSIPGIGDAFAPLGDAVGSVMNGTTDDIQGALDDAATRANEILQQNRDTYGDAPATQ